jgi:hypothetical protein
MIDTLLRCPHGCLYCMGKRGCPFAQGTEARRAETAQQGSVHDGPVRDSECAQRKSA